VKKIYLLATVAAILTGCAVFLFITQLQTSAEQAAAYETELVVVAAINIPENTKLTPAMLKFAEIPKGTAPENVVTDIETIVGKTTKYPLQTGEQLFLGKVAEIGDLSNDRLSDRIKEGYRAFTIYVNEVSGLAGYLRTGDRVDILVTKTVDGVQTTSYLFQNIPIIAVGTAVQYANEVKEINTYSSITLELPAADCPMLNHNISQGLVTIVLRGYGDEMIIEAPVYSEGEN
jgi:pilus assembly protein CpaB